MPLSVDRHFARRALAGNGGLAPARRVGFRSFGARFRRGPARRHVSRARPLSPRDGEARRRRKAGGPDSRRRGAPRRAPSRQDAWPEAHGPRFDPARDAGRRNPFLPAGSPRQDGSRRPRRPDRWKARGTRADVPVRRGKRERAPPQELRDPDPAGAGVAPHFARRQVRGLGRGLGPNVAPAGHRFADEGHGSRLGLSIEAWNETPGPSPRYSVVSVATGELLYETSKDLRAFKRLLQ